MHDARAIFVTGAGRSGTKFLMNLLNRHPDVYIGPELHLFSRILHKGFLYNLRRKQKVNPDGMLTLDMVVDCILNDKHFGTYWHLNKITEEEIRAWFEGKEAVTEKLIYQFLMEHDRDMYPSKREVAYLGEKTPSNVFHLHELIQWFPQSIIFYIFRNPIAVLESEVNKRNKPGYPIKKSNPLYAYGLVVFVLVTWWLGARNALKHQDHEKMVFVSYELLSRDTEAALETLLAKAQLAPLASEPQVKRVDSSFSDDDARNHWRAPGWVRWLYSVSTSSVFSELSAKAA